MKRCARCKEFQLSDNMFGFCKKYKIQALINENCKKIEEKVKS